MTRARWYQPFVVVLTMMMLSLTLPTLPARGAAMLRVTPDGTGDTDCGGTWATACSLQAALAKAAPGDEIWVAQGVYTPGGTVAGGDRTATFLVPGGVALYGGFAGTETGRASRNPVANPTILSGDIDANDTGTDGVARTWDDIQGSNAYHVLTFDTTTAVDASTVIDGFVITAGQATGPAPEDRGGGIYCPFLLERADCSPTLSNLVVSGNRASFGAGMFTQAIGDATNRPTLDQVTFSGNRATVSGGGLYSQNGSYPVLTGVTFSGNWADTGGGLYSGSKRSTAGVTLTGGEFTGNYAELEGGGAYITSYISMHTATFTGVDFRDNRANTGGGLFNDAREGITTLALTGVTFDGNIADLNGGGFADVAGIYGVAVNAPDDMVSPLLTGVTFTRNRAHGSGGGMYSVGNPDATRPVLRNVTFAGNQAALGGGLACAGDGGTCQAQVHNALFSGNFASREGGGLYLYGVRGGTSDVSLGNTTFADNAATDRGGAIASTAYLGGSVQLTLANVLVWGNTAGSDVSISYVGEPEVRHMSLSHSLVEGWTEDAPNHVWGDRDPLFVAPAAGAAPTTGGDYHLQSTSPAIDAGSNIGMPDDLTVDLDGEPRFVDVAAVTDTGTGTAPLVDMGAYEASGTPGPAPSPTPPTVPGVDANPDLTLTQTVSPAQVLPGQAVTFTLSFTNTSLMTATGVALSAFLPEVVTSAEVGDWTIPQLAPGAAESRTLSGVVSATLSADAIVTATATLTTDAGDADPDDNYVETPLRIVVPRVGFATGGYYVTEERASAPVTVTLDAANPYAAVQVDYATAADTATPGVDYTPVTGTLTFPAGTTTATFTVPVIDDGEDEGYERVQLVLANPRGAALGARATATLEIGDPGMASPTGVSVYLPVVSSQSGVVHRVASRGR